MRTLLVLAVLPAAVLLAYVYRIDPREKEPASLLGRLLLAGMASTVPAMVVEVALTATLFGDAEPLALRDVLVDNFLVVGLTEELCKFVALKGRSWRDPAFDHVFDGIVYAVFAGLGFAIAENVLYVLEFGPQTAVVRAFTAIPGHCMFAVFMGFFYGHARLARSRGHGFACALLGLFAIAVPVVLHGAYDTLASIETVEASALFLVLLALMVVVGMGLAKHVARRGERI